jgi:glycosyltransferase involved in cell wall biosynthesis
MIAARTCAAVIPCLNERVGIAGLVAALRQQLPRVLVVDDGSEDDTAVLARTAGATVLRHGRNLGKGVALQTGLAQARSLGFDWALTLDGDGQHAPGDLPVFLQSAACTGARLIIGNRMRQAPAIPWLRRQVNRWMSCQLSRRAGRHLPDTQCGFRLIHLKTWAGLSLSTEHFEIESEMLMAFLAARHPVEFVPIRVIGRSRRSHIRPVIDTLRWWKWWSELKRLEGSYARAGSPVRVTLPAAAQAPAPPC